MAWIRSNKRNTGGGGHTVTLVDKNYIKMEIFTGLNLGKYGFTLKSNYKLELIFHETSNTFFDGEIILGNSGSNYCCFLGVYNNRWYTSNGSNVGAFGNWSGGADHTFIQNNGNGHNEFDGTEISPFSASDLNYDILLGCRNNVGTSNGYQGYIKRFRIYDLNNNNEILLDLNPKQLYIDNVLAVEGLYDEVSHRWFCHTSMIFTGDTPL